MCDKCDAVDRELATYQRLLPTIDDKFALALIAEFVKDVQSERAALHADHAKNGGETGQPQLAASSISDFASWPDSALMSAFAPLLRG